MSIFKKAKEIIEILPGLEWDEETETVESLRCVQCGAKMERTTYGTFLCPTCGDEVEEDMAAYYVENSIFPPYEDIWDDE